MIIEWKKNQPQWTCKRGEIFYSETPFFRFPWMEKNFRSRIIIHTYGTGFTVNRKEQTVGFLYKTPFVFKVLPRYILTVSLNSGGTLLWQKCSKGWRKKSSFHYAPTRDERGVEISVCKTSSNCWHTFSRFSSRTTLRLESLEDAVVLESEDDLLTDKHGCPAYVSPEILRTNSQYSGRAADMWGLGVMLYTLLVGR